MRYLIPLIYVLTACAPAGAQSANLSLPLMGHYRVGRYMPLRLSIPASATPTIFSLTAANALTTDVHTSAAGTHVIVPWLSIRSIRDVHWSMNGVDHPIDLPLSPLSDDECLIGYVGADPDVLAAELPGKTFVRVPLDLADPLAGETTAWEALDGIALDATSAGRISEGKIAELLSAGTAIAIRSHQMPGGGWPWKHRGNYWVARIEIAGPTSAYFPEGYAPTHAWTRGWPENLRKRLLAIAAIVGILMIAVTLWRSKWSWVAVVLLCAIATASIATWKLRYSPQIQAGGSIFVLCDLTTQRDQWTYFSTLASVHARVPWRPMGRPVFGYRGQWTETDCRLVCRADGQPIEFRYQLQPRQTLAFQVRELFSDPRLLKSSSPIRSPLAALADGSYTRANDQLVGQIDEADADLWPAIVVVKQGKK